MACIYKDDSGKEWSFWIEHVGEGDSEIVAQICNPARPCEWIEANARCLSDAELGRNLRQYLKEYGHAI